MAMKSELLMSICEQQMGAGQLGAYQKSIIDRCTAAVYHDFIKSGSKASQPLLTDWRREVKAQPEREAEELALASELFIEGSLNMFAHETNVNMENRIVAFDLYEMGEQLKPTALTVTMEMIQNRVELSKLLNISQSQMGHITNAPAGHGLLRVGGSIVPFANDFPRDGELYRLWSTTPGEP